MTTSIVLLLVISSTAALVWAVMSGSPAMRWLKMLASSGFIAVALSAGSLSSLYGQIVLAALVLSWIGDLLLTYESEKAFLGGLGAFLAGHVAYSVAFVTLGVNPAAGVLGAVAAGIITVYVWRWLSPHVGGMKGPVAAYVAIISVMVVLAFGTFGDGNTWLIPAGATLFFLSDLLVARNRFIDPGIINRLWGLPLYYAAQVMLALSVAR